MGETTFKTDDGNLIGTIQRSVATEKIEVDAVDFVTRQVFDPPKPARASALVTHTLQSVVDYLAADEQIDHVIPAAGVAQVIKGIAVHVVSPTEVRVVSELSFRWRERETFISAECIDVIGPVFKFGVYYDLERFVISLRSLFAETEDVEALIKILGRVEDSAVKQFDDDGISQSVTATVGIATKRDVPVPTIVTLIPFRTFPEIEQVKSEFFLRLRKGDEDEPPEAALFETDGGLWKIEAINRVAEFLREANLTVPIIA